MKVISVITEKGGVGKTTTVIHLGAALSEMGTRVLLIDFDSQRNLSDGYKIPEDYSYTIKNFLDGDGDFRVTQKKENLFILCGDRNIEKEKYKRYIIKERLELLNSMMNFDFVLIDCPPRPLNGDLILGELALSSSDYVISPIWAEEYSIKGINKLFPSIQRIIDEYNGNLDFLGFFFNMVKVNSRNFKEYSIKAKEQAGEFVLDTYIREDVKVEYAKKLGKTVFQIAPKSRVAEDFKQLAKELLSKINN